MTKQQHIEQVSNRIDECETLYSNYKKKYNIGIISFIVLLIVAVAFFVVHITVKEELFVYDWVLLICVPIILICIGCIPIVSCSENLKDIEAELEILEKILYYYDAGMTTKEVVIEMERYKQSVALNSRLEKITSAIFLNFFR